MDTTDLTPDQIARIKAMRGAPVGPVSDAELDAQDKPITQPPAAPSQEPTDVSGAPVSPGVAPASQQQSDVAGQEKLAASLGAAGLQVPGAPPPKPAMSADPRLARGGATAAPSGATPPTDIRDALLQDFMARQPTAPGSAKAVGFAKSDRAYADSLKQQAVDLTQTTNDALVAHQQANEAFAANTQALLEDTQIGRAKFAQEQAENAKRRAALDEEVKANQQRIDAQLAQDQAQGVDPNRYWHNLGTGGSIGMAIAMGLGTWGSTLARAPNAVVQMVSDSIGRDIDAQKTNLAKSLEITKARGAFNQASFDQRKALLEAERDSIQTGYTIALNTIGKQAALYGQQAEIQQKAAAMTAGLKEDLIGKVAGINDRLYALNKGAERVVGGAAANDPNKIRAAIAARTADILDKAHANGREISVVDARRQAAEEQGLIPTAPGETGPDQAKVKEGSGKENARDEESILAHKNAIANIKALQALRDKHGGGNLWTVGAGANDTSAADALAARTQEQLVAALGKTNQGLLDRTSHLIPDHPLDVRLQDTFGGDQIGTSLSTARRMLEDELARQEGRDPDVERNPKGLTPEK